MLSIYSFLKNTSSFYFNKSRQLQLKELAEEVGSVPLQSEFYSRPKGALRVQLPYMAEKNFHSGTNKNKAAKP